MFGVMITMPYFFSTLTRIADLQTRPFDIQALPRAQWATGDYVVGRVVAEPGCLGEVELANGRVAKVMNQDLVVGAFGVRQATLEAVGDWRAIGDDGLMDDMTIAGIFGRVTSKSFFLGPLTRLKYQGHVMRDRHKVCMKDFVASSTGTEKNTPVQTSPVQTSGQGLKQETFQSNQYAYHCPTVLIIGTSMSAGKTTAARAVIHQLKSLGLKVIGTKLTGVGRYRDILAMKDAGADWIYDFVDVGLPSSICDPELYRQSLRKLLSVIAARQPDVVVAEAGASPYEPYNGAIVLEEMSQQMRCTILCASDPYAVIGVSQSFGLEPDIVSGVTTSTTAGVNLVEKLTHFKALRLPAEESISILRSVLTSKLGLA